MSTSLGPLVLKGAFIFKIAVYNSIPLALQQTTKQVKKLRGQWSSGVNITDCIKYREN